MKKYFLFLLIVLLFSVSSFSQCLNNRGEKIIDYIELNNGTIIDFKYYDDNNLKEFTINENTVNKDILVADGYRCSFNEFGHLQFFESICDKLVNRLDFHYNDDKFIETVKWSSKNETKILEELTFNINYGETNVNTYSRKMRLSDSDINDTNVNLNWLLSVPFNPATVYINYLYITEWCGGIQKQLFDASYYDNSDNLFSKYIFKRDKNNNITEIKIIYTDNNVEETICKITYV